MTVDRMIELLECEHECMLCNAHEDCNRDCENCDLVQDDGELHEMYLDVIEILSKRKPIYPVITYSEFTSYNDECYRFSAYTCGECGYKLDGNRDRYCPMCGRKIKWE